MINPYKTLAGKSEGKFQLESVGMSKITILSCKCVESTRLALDRVQWRAVVNVVG
jgi:hypothetical protein